MLSEAEASLRCVWPGEALPERFLDSARNDSAPTTHEGCEIPAFAGMAAYRGVPLCLYGIL